MAGRAAVAAAIGLRWAFDPWLGDYVPLVTLFGAVAFSVWLGGYGPALVSMVLGYLAADWLFAQPRGQLEWHTREFVAVTGYLASCALIIGLGHRMRTSEAQLREAVAERKLAQSKAEALSHEHARQRQFLATLLDNATVCVAVMAGRDLRYTFVNRAYQALRPEAPMLGRLYREVFPEAVSSGAEALQQAV